ncbi:hypothetical protein TNCV_675781 [Trichonephila clavipes]|nr:hypothetical protein TNCV_675781 [Trichonephila clavipes]
MPRTRQGEPPLAQLASEKFNLIELIPMYDGSESLGIRRFLGKNNDVADNLVLSTAARNANDQLLQSRFISGLRNDIRRFVLARDPNTLEESNNTALVEEQNLKLNEIASNERSGLSSLPPELPVISALTNKLQELNLRVERLQEASTVIAQETSKGESHRKVNVFKHFYCGLEGHRQAECRKRIADQHPWNSPVFEEVLGMKLSFLVPRAFNLSIIDAFVLKTQPLGVFHPFHKEISVTWEMQAVSSRIEGMKI